MEEIAPAYAAVTAAIREARRWSSAERRRLPPEAAAAHARFRCAPLRPWSLLAALGMLLMRCTALLRNAQETGTALSRSYAAEESRAA